MELQVFGGFAIDWPTEIKTLLTQISIVNFNWNLMFFACHDERPTFMTNWILFQLLPVFYALVFFS